VLIYRATLIGAKVEITQESYAGKAGFLDLDKIPVYDPNNEERSMSLAVTTHSGGDAGRR
jgi:hypothetical protein